MAEILNFPWKRQSQELERLRCKLIELNESREAIIREIRITRDMIKLLEKGEPR